MTKNNIKIHRTTESDQSIRKYSKQKKNRKISFHRIFAYFNLISLSLLEYTHLPYAHILIMEDIILEYTLIRVCHKGR